MRLLCAVTSGSFPSGGLPRVEIRQPGSAKTAQSSDIEVRIRHRAYQSYEQHIGRPYTGRLCKFLGLGKDPQKPYAGPQSHFRQWKRTVTSYGQKSRA